jgi:hypothetical protein
MPRDAWYTRVRDDELNQGDLITNCSVILPKAGPLIRVPQPISNDDAANKKVEKLPYELLKQTVDIVVMTQSCDLTNQKSTLVLVCPHYSLTQIFDELKRQNENQKLPLQKLIERLRSQAQNVRAGKTVGRYMLAPCNLRRSERGVRIVDFERAFSVPHHYLRNLADGEKQRLRIKSPYREHLSQAFAVFFMRVALNADVSKDLVNAEVGKLEGQQSSVFGER